MWFPNGVWFIIREFLFPIWGRNPWLKKYDVVVASLPKCLFSRQPRRLIKFFENGSIKFTIELEYLDWCLPPQIWTPWVNEGRQRYCSFIKIYTLDNV